jgi:ABC-type glycerol-3-phosphate transport system substrate-binding protein
MFANLLQDKSKIFKSVTIVLSVIIGLVAILIFSGKFPGIENESAKNTNKPTIRIWGTIADKTFRDSLTSYQTEGNAPLSIEYSTYSKDILSRKLIEASSQGFGPDLVIAPYSDILSVSSLFYVIPYTYMTELDFKNIYVDSTHILTTPFGASFYPLLLDPQIMIFNKKILSENGFAFPPNTWTELPKYQSKLTIYNTENKPEQSAFGIGANNVVNKDLTLFTQLFQVGANPAKPIWGRNIDNSIALGYNNDIGLSGSDYNDVTSNLFKILKFQTAFSDPQKTSFTWSETDVTDLEKFISGKVGIYFGKSSDIDNIKFQNPNLDIGLYFMPQMEKATYQAVAADMIGVAITKNTKDFPYAVSVAQIVADKNFSRNLSFSTGMAGARRDVLYGNDGSERSEVVSRSTLVSKLIYNNNPSSVSGSIYNLYNNILSARRTLQEAIEIFSKDWGSIYKTQ